MSSVNQKELVGAMFTALAKLSRHRYFLDELWTKIGKWGHNDRADVQAAFVSKCIYERTGLPVYPMGMSWSYIGGMLNMLKSIMLSTMTSEMITLNGVMTKDNSPSNLNR